MIIKKGDRQMFKIVQQKFKLLERMSEWLIDRKNERKKNEKKRAAMIIYSVFLLCLFFNLNS